MNIKRVLQKMVELKASDLHVKVGTKPTARANGSLVTLDEPAPSQADLEAIVEQILTPKQKKTFEDTKEVDFAFGVTGLSRFRTNFYQQRAPRGRAGWCSCAARWEAASPRPSPR